MYYRVRRCGFAAVNALSTENYSAFLTAFRTSDDNRHEGHRATRHSKVMRMRFKLTSDDARGHSAVLWILLAAAIGFGFNAGFVSPLHSPAQAQQVEQPDTAATEQRDTISTLLQRLSTIPARTWDNPVAFYTFVLAIFTVSMANS
jgi:hypothetical protein